MPYLRVTDSDDDDFVQQLTKIEASEQDVKVQWKIPNRLVRNPDLLHGVIDELLAELHECIAKKSR